MSGDDGLRAFVLGLVDRPGVPPAIARELADSIAAWHAEELAALRAKAAGADRAAALLGTWQRCAADEAGADLRIWAAALRRALDGADRTDRGRC